MIEPVGLAEAIVWGASGGLVLSMVDVVEDATRARPKRRSRDSIYWVVFAFRPISGALLVLLYMRSGSSMNAIADFGTGLTGPSIIQALSRRAHLPSVPTHAVED